MESALILARSTSMPIVAVKLTQIMLSFRIRSCPDKSLYDCPLTSAWMSSLAVNHSKDCGGTGATVFFREAQEASSSTASKSRIVVFECRSIYVHFEEAKIHIFGNMATPNGIRDYSIITSSICARWPRNASCRSRRVPSAVSGLSSCIFRPLCSRLSCRAPRRECPSKSDCRARR